ncbi:LytR/AlgR family response regulator transcription factor [Dawidia soli]|uniref:LytTR family DNA-binding domain-containing protein n=1 Tax=Dawidia soli TaxID=2782352 RepID=A0AAP2GLP5_9BACT|nr:LytTR family DNA-binding domain-containing protein [Dawidia soli]MBT1690755.1 LytTR family DNA-binding domain-containing protein [Dawidia soli]
MYKAVIIEDEHRLREALSILLEMVAGDAVVVVGYAEHVDDAVRLVNRLKPDLVFMDIILKDGTGFDVLQRLDYRGFRLIFTTAYEEYAIRAFKFSAIDYLLKPIDPEELRLAIGRIKDLQEKVVGEQQLQELQDNLQKAPERLVLPTLEAMHVVKVDEIVRCETSGSYTTFLLADGRKIIVSKPLKNYEDMLLPPLFFRVHQSHLINVHYIQSYSKEGLILMKDKTSIPLSRTKKEAFFKLMTEDGGS